MTLLEDLLERPQFSVPQREKSDLLQSGLEELTLYHRRNCTGYDRILSLLDGDRRVTDLASIPYLPATLFKTHALRSVPEHEIFKTLTSSGTTGQQASRIVLDRETARLQSTALSKIMMHVLGPRRLPMVLIESSGLIKNRESLSARAAGLVGMANFGRSHFYALDDNMELNEPGLREFLAHHGNAPFLIFGFTFMAWQYLLLRIAHLNIDLSNGILVHSGGWKKLQQMAVTNAEFKRRFQEATGLHRIFNFYGMVEQVGSVFLEGEDGYLYPPNFADVIIRDPVTWQEAPVGSTGVIQVLSLLPRSYPGHSLLTEDLGVIHGIDDSTCGRMGKRFSVIGRVPRAELRGCSDTHAASVA
jgi:Acyl-protein synthetase, LuxE